MFNAFWATVVFFVFYYSYLLFYSDTREQYVSTKYHCITLRPRVMLLGIYKLVIKWSRIINVHHRVTMVWKRRTCVPSRVRRPFPWRVNLSLKMTGKWSGIVRKYDTCQKHTDTVDYRGTYFDSVAGNTVLGRYKCHRETVMISGRIRVYRYAWRG